MKKLFLICLIFSFCHATGITYLNDSLPDNAGASVYNTNSVSKIGDTYYKWDNKTQSYTGYRVQENKIYGSDGSSYTRFGNTIQNNSTGQTYQINNNFIQQLY